MNGLLTQDPGLETIELVDLEPSPPCEWEHAQADNTFRIAMLERGRVIDPSCTHVGVGTLVWSRCKQSKHLLLCQPTIDVISVLITDPPSIHNMCIGCMSIGLDNPHLSDCWKLVEL